MSEPVERFREQYDRELVLETIANQQDEIERLRADLARVTQERDEARAIVHMLPDDVLAKARRLVEAAEAAREVRDE